MSHPRRLAVALAGSVLILALAGCDFPGPALTVAFTSPPDGARIVGSRTVTVTGEVQGAAPTTFRLTLDGTEVPLPLPAGGSFTATVDLADGANALVATATAASGASATATLDLVYPYVLLGDGQAAAVVIGQTSFTAALPDTTQQRLRAPAGAPALVGGRLYLPDTGNHRVVGLAAVPSYNGAAFDVLLGQTTWTDGTAAPIGAGALAGPSSVAGGSGDLVVADTGNNRVLVYSGAPTLTGAAAALAVGQPGLYSNGDTSCTAARLDAPRAAVVAGGRLIVADTAHHRVLVWNQVPTVSGTAADLVLGQAKLTSSDDPQLCLADRGLAGPTASSLSSPSGVWSDGTRLAVADTGNHRVLIWNAFPTTNGQPANVVLGQATMATAAAASGPSGLDGPRSLDANGNQLFVADTGNHRVLIFAPFPSADAAAASGVLGQADLSGNAANRGGAAGGATLSGPQGVRVFDGMLMVADTGNSRELIYLP